jgi:CRISPR-associated protein Csm2
MVAKLAELLQDKSFIEKAAWYRVLSYCKYDKRTEQLKNVNNIECNCKEILLDMDSKIVNYVKQYRGSERGWNRELTELKDGIIEKDIIPFITQGKCLSQISAEELVACAQCLGALLAADVKTTQIRRFLSAVMEREVAVKGENPEDFKKDQVIYLKVYLAYAAGRHKEVLLLLRVVEPMLELVSPEGRKGWGDFQVFLQFVRSVVAYHKFYGGREKE